MELAPIFQYELCPVPPSLIDEYDTLRKRSKAPLVHDLCMKTKPTLLHDVTIVDVSQLLYHIVWPLRGDASVIEASINTRLSTIAGDKVFVFDNAMVCLQRPMYSCCSFTGHTDPISRSPCRWTSGMEQFWTSMSPVLNSVRSASSSLGCTI